MTDIDATVATRRGGRRFMTIKISRVVLHLSCSENNHDLHKSGKMYVNEDARLFNKFLKWLYTFLTIRINVNIIVLY